MTEGFILFSSAPITIKQAKAVAEHAEKHFWMRLYCTNCGNGERWQLPFRTVVEETAWSIHHPERTLLIRFPGDSENYIPECPTCGVQKIKK
jgi:hypothetical protein